MNWKQRILNILPSKVICYLEYKRQKLNYNERSIEYGFVFKCITEIQPKTILDVGTGTTALPHLMRNCGPIVTAIDNIKDFWPSGMRNRHYFVLDRDITKFKSKEKFDMITCISVLEHIGNFQAAIDNMMDLLNDGGYLVLTFPYNENLYIPNVYDLPDSNAYGKIIPYICQSFSHNEVWRWGKIIRQEYWQCWTGDYWTSENQIPPVQVTRNERHQLTCILIKK